MSDKKIKKIRFKKPDFLYQISKEIHTFEMCCDVGLSYFTTNIPRIKISLDVCPTVEVNKFTIKTSKDVVDFVKNLYLTVMNDAEYFIVLFLNRRNIPIAFFEKEGITAGVLIDYRKIIFSGYMLNASGMVLIHNHPTGNPSPSEADKEMTKNFNLIAEVLEMKVLDSIIIAQNSYFSFADEGIF